LPAKFIYLVSTLSIRLIGSRVRDQCTRTAVIRALGAGGVKE